jgi:hypothetical protein
MTDRPIDDRRASPGPPGVLREGRDGRRLIGGGLLLRRTPAMPIPLYAGVRLRAVASGRAVGPGEWSP